MNPDVDIIIDASSLYARSFFAAKRSETDPVVAGLRSLMGVINHTRATRAVLCWDGKRKSSKVRDEKPADYEDVRSIFKETTTWLWNIPHVLSEEHEADDLVASYVYSQVVSKDTFVVSGDKDLQQLIGCRKPDGFNIQYYCLNTKEILDPERVIEKWNVKRPSHIAIALAILGDPSDGIPGIKGWGPARVEKLFGAVSTSNTFEEAVLIIDDQVPECKKPEFYECLEATILHQDAVLSDEPRAFEWRSPLELDGTDFFDIKGQYSTLYYNTKPSNDDLI